MTENHSGSAPTGHRILVVDDDPDIRENLNDILTDLGFRVFIAADGHAALELLQAEPVDVALVDLRMPGMDGLTLTRKIKALGTAVVPILVTAYAGFVSPEELASSGTWRVVNKPINLPSLLGLVDEALDQPLVLVVDDDHALCANLGDIFRERGFRVSIVHGVHQAESGLDDSVPSVVLIDMKLPDGDGIHVLRHVRNEHPEVRTILVTGYPREMDGLITEARREGVDAVCLKPFDVPSLLELLENLSTTS